MDYKARYNEWLEKLSDSDPLKKELLDIKGDDKEIEDRFYQDLSFGISAIYFLHREKLDYKFR